MRQILAVLLPVLAVAAGPEFDAAVIKPSAPMGNGPVRVGCSGGPGSPDPVSFSCQNINLSNLITMAYNLQRFEYSAPEWLNGERFDLTAKVPEGATREDFLLMQRALLRERFGLVVHKEKKEMVAYDLVVMKNGPKFKWPLNPLRSPKTRHPGRCK